MAFNGSGTFLRLFSWVTDAASAIPITASRVDAEDSGFATGLSNVICRDGQSTITANLPMSGFAHTGVANATARTQYAALGQVQDSSVVWGGTGGGTGDVITLSMTPVITAYVAGQNFSFISSAANTTNVTLNINSLGAKAVTKQGATALVAGDIPSGAIVEVGYDGTQFQIKNVNFATTLAPLASPAFTGNPTAPTQAPATNNTRLATTAYTDAAAAVVTAAIPVVATQAQQETSTSTAVFVSPGRQQYHPSAAKAWCVTQISGGTPVGAATYNISSITDNGVGDFTYNFTVSFSSGTYCYTGTAVASAGVYQSSATAPSPGSCRMVILGTNSLVAADNNHSVLFFGDQP